ncbi:hypothetical protein P7C73_g2673, partial [Tremellales sp. Uapishka_1]
MPDHLLPAYRIDDAAGPSSLPTTRASSPTPSLRRPTSHGRLTKLMTTGRDRSSSSASEETTSLVYAEDALTTGRTTPEQRRRTGKDKCLQSFDSINEWADFISFLSRLLKTLQTSSPPYTEIPRKLIVAKRLAQCLNPALPSGVHQRALDVYAHIFGIIGIEGLKRDLLIWSSGLFPFFQFAATSVRPSLINIYETYYLPLGPNLRPAMKALILALLPGIEEETGDFFDKILSLLGRLSDAVSPPFFLQNVFVILISTASSRLSSLNYLSKKMLEPPREAQYTGLMVRGVAAVLEDENVLVRRSGLDLLLRVFVMDGDVFKSAESKDKELLMRAASAVVLQRELSLSRRIYTWLLGPDDLQHASGMSNEWCTLIVQSDMAAMVTSPIDPLRPFKIFLSLMDKWEVDAALSEKLGIPALRAIKLALPTLPIMLKEEVSCQKRNALIEQAINTASAVYEAVEPIILWRFLYNAVTEELNGNVSDVRLSKKETANGQGIEMTSWLLESIPQHDQEVNCIHAPAMLYGILRVFVDRESGSTVSGIRLAVDLLAIIPQHLLTSIATPSSPSADPAACSSISALYAVPDVNQEIATQIRNEVCPWIISHSFDICKSVLEDDPTHTAMLLGAVELVTRLIEYDLPALRTIEWESWMNLVLSGLARSAALEVLQMLISRGDVARSLVEGLKDEAIFDCIDTLTPSAQRVVAILCEIMSGKSSRSSSSESRFDPSLLGFLEAYISRLEGPIAVQIWSTMYTFAKDNLNAAGIPAARSSMYPILRCLTILGKTVATTSALEDRRLRRDLQDTYSKVLDIVVTNASRIAETPIWERKAAAKSEDVNGGLDQSNLLQQVSPPISNLVIELTLTLQIYVFISTSVISSLRTFLSDQDKVAAACYNISATIILPAFKQHKVETSILQILSEMTRIPSAVRAWRPSVGDAFNDSRFFKSQPETTAYWKPLICSLMDSDKERLPELLSRIVAAPSTNIFTNRDQEMVARSLNLRRLSFVLLAAEKNHLITQLPSIQEKLVEILRTNVVSPKVHSEVYLCLRVLTCRISPQHLTNFWPVILTELLRVFEATMDEPPADGSEQLQLVLAACKFLDLLLVIQSEDFQIHQWMFVTDTTDAIYPSEPHTPEAIMDRLSEILSEQSHTHAEPDTEILIPSRDTLRCPRLSSIKQVSSLYQLQPFFSRASIDTFEGLYHDVGVDWDAVEDGLNREIFD